MVTTIRKKIEHGKAFEVTEGSYLAFVGAGSLEYTGESDTYAVKVESSSTVDRGVFHSGDSQRGVSVSHDCTLLEPTGYFGDSVYGMQFTGSHCTTKGAEIYGGKTAIDSRGTSNVYLGCRVYDAQHNAFEAQARARKTIFCDCHARNGEQSSAGAGFKNESRSALSPDASDGHTLTAIKCSSHNYYTGCKTDKAQGTLLIDFKVTSDDGVRSRAIVSTGNTDYVVCVDSELCGQVWAYASFQLYANVAFTFGGHASAVQVSPSAEVLEFRDCRFATPHALKGRNDRITARVRFVRCLLPTDWLDPASTGFDTKPELIDCVFYEFDDGS